MIFRNFEEVKIHVTNPDLVNGIVLGLLLLLAVFTIRRNSSLSMLGRDSTSQLKGVAIIFIIVGHFWTHVATYRPLVHLAGYGVSMFFILSGYGLSVSALAKQLSLWQYFQRRLIRVFLPYWIATVVIIFLDFFFLERIIPLDALMWTSIGVNISSIASHLDYTRWFITLLLLWYVLHYLVNKIFRPPISAFVILVCAVVIFLVNYYFFSFGWHQIFAFPAGCMLAGYKQGVERTFQQYTVIMIVGAGILVSAVTIWKVDPSGQHNLEYLPDIILLLIREFQSLVFCLALIVIFGAGSVLGKSSYFLNFVGAISFELFLLHGPFLIKYNPVIFSEETGLLSFQFCVFIVLILLLSFLFHRLVNHRYT